MQLIDRVRAEKRKENRRLYALAHPKKKRMSPGGIREGLKRLEELVIEAERGRKSYSSVAEMLREAGFSSGKLTRTPGRVDLLDRAKAALNSTNDHNCKRQRFLNALRAYARTGQCLTVTQVNLSIGVSEGWSAKKPELQEAAKWLARENKKRPGVAKIDELEAILSDMEEWDFSSDMPAKPASTVGPQPETKPEPAKKDPQGALKIVSPEQMIEIVRRDRRNRDEYFSYREGYSQQYSALPPCPKSLQRNQQKASQLRAH